MELLYVEKYSREDCRFLERKKKNFVAFFQACLFGEGSWLIAEAPCYIIQFQDWKLKGERVKVKKGKLNILELQKKKTNYKFNYLL